MFNFKLYNSFENVLSNCYIAKRKDNLLYDDYGNATPQYETPNATPYKWNIQPVNIDSSTDSFGEREIKMKVAMLVGDEAKKFRNSFHQNDLAYLEDATPDGEAVNGSNANYRIYAVRPQNVALLIYFEKIV